MRNVYWVVITATLFGFSCGGAGNGTPATAETADDPAAADPLDTAFGAEEAPQPEAAEPPDEPGEAAGDTAEQEEEIAEEETPAPDSNAPPPSGDLNAYVGTGATTPEYRTITANMDLIKRCYLDALSRDEDLQGVMRVQFTVNKKGQMIKAKAVENELTPEVAKCVVNTMKKLKFPKRADKRTTEYPFKFFPTPSQ